MYHHSHPLVESSDEAIGLQSGDVVLFRFPVSEDGDSPVAPKRRPCLVLNIVHWGPDRFVELAYGTASEGRANRGLEVRVRHPQSLAIAGLSKPTRFVCGRRIIVHICNAGFDGSGGSKPPLIGHLDEALFKRMNAVKAHM